MSFKNYRKLGFAVTESDTAVPRNDLGYLILDKNNNPQSISIPIVTQLFEFGKYREVVDIEFLELFPPILTPPVDVAALLAQITALNAALSASLLVQVEPTPVEFDLWRTRKTFKRIVDKPINPYGAGTDAWTSIQQWSDFNSVIQLIFGPSLTPELQTLISEYRAEVALITATIGDAPQPGGLFGGGVNFGVIVPLTSVDDAIQPQQSPRPLTYTDISAIGQFINDENIGNVDTFSPLLNQSTMTFLQSTNRYLIKDVKDSQINALVWGDIPWPYYTYINPISNRPFVTSMSEFRHHCKKIVYWLTIPQMMNINNDATINNIIGSGNIWRVLNNTATQAELITLYDTIGRLENTPLKDSNGVTIAPVGATGYFANIR
jgi:hypothetical protein